MPQLRVTAAAAAARFITNHLLSQSFIKRQEGRRNKSALFITTHYIHTGCLAEGILRYTDFRLRKSCVEFRLQQAKESQNEPTIMEIHENPPKSYMTFAYQ